MLNAEEWLEAYRQAWITRDPDAAAALFTEDSRYREMPYQEAFEGAQGVRDYWARVTEAQSDVEVRYGAPLTVGNRTAVEWWVTMKNGGQDVTLAGEFMLTFADDGRCHDLREYWHFEPRRVEPFPGWGE